MGRDYSKKFSEQNYKFRNAGQERYAYEQYQLARVRHGFEIEHEIPSLTDTEEINQVEADNDIPAVPQHGHTGEKQAGEIQNQDMSTGEKRASADSTSGGIQKKSKTSEGSSGSHPGTGKGTDGQSSESNEAL